MEESVFVGDGGSCEVVMAEFHCVQDDENLGERVNHLEAAIVFLLDLLRLTRVHFQCRLLLAMFARFLDLKNLVLPGDQLINH